MQKTEGIILAAGLSSRVGTNKLVLNIDGVTVIEKCILGMYDICSRIIVVGGHRVEDIKNILDKYPKVDLIYNSNYKNGMFSSVKKGLANVREERFFLIPGDYPLVSKETYEEMLKLDEDIIIPIYHGKRGHPLLVKSYLIKKLFTDDSCKTLRDFINKRGFTPVNVKDSGILKDIDTMDDYISIAQDLKALR
ncbi:MAG TPA: nucleotidyltransferase family protein [Tissierellales bacterium]|nr:nucleotidyltransferase family protein [Tissierellales bacterium]